MQNKKYFLATFKEDHTLSDVSNEKMDVSNGNKMTSAMECIIFENIIMGIQFV